MGLGSPPRRWRRWRRMAARGALDLRKGPPRGMRVGGLRDGVVRQWGPGPCWVQARQLSWYPNVQTPCVPQGQDVVGVDERRMLGRFLTEFAALAPPAWFGARTGGKQNLRPRPDEHVSDGRRVFRFAKVRSRRPSHSPRSRPST